jgi:hypothetical protein
MDVRGPLSRGSGKTASWTPAVRSVGFVSSRRSALGRDAAAERPGAAEIKSRYALSYALAIRFAEKRSSKRARTFRLSSLPRSPTALTACSSFSTMKPVTPSSTTSGTEPER